MALQPIPISILNEILKLPGNQSCCDCTSLGTQFNLAVHFLFVYYLNILDISWASISHGTLICLECAGKHRSLGVQTSFVNSLYMDHWSAANVEMLRQGGNQSIRDYFTLMGVNKEKVSIVELYRSEAALHYRERLRERVDHILSQAVRTPSKTPNSFREFHRVHSGLKRMKSSELISVIFDESLLGFRLSKRHNNSAVVSRVTSGGSAEKNGVMVGDAVWGVGDQVIDDYDTLLRLVTENTARPLRIYFYREVGEEEEEGGGDNDAASSDLGLGRLHLGGSDVGSEDEECTTTNDSDSDTASVAALATASVVDDSARMNFDYRVDFQQGPLGITIARDGKDRTEVTGVFEGGQAKLLGVLEGDLVVGVDNQWFSSYEESSSTLSSCTSFPLTVVFRRIHRDNIRL